MGEPWPLGTSRQREGFHTAVEAILAQRLLPLAELRRICDISKTCWILELAAFPQRLIRYAEWLRRGNAPLPASADAAQGAHWHRGAPDLERQIRRQRRAQAARGVEGESDDDAHR